MRNYQMVFIIHPEFDEDQANEVISDVKDLISRNDGEVTKVEPWGLRKLAYPIQKQHEGRYVLIELELAPEKVADIERVLNLMEPVIRQLIVRLDL